MTKLTDVVTLKQYVEMNEDLNGDEDLRRLRRECRDDESNWAKEYASKFGRQWVIDVEAPTPDLPEGSRSRRKDGRVRYMVYVNAEELEAIQVLLADVDDPIIDPRERAARRRKRRKAAEADADADTKE